MASGVYRPSFKKVRGRPERFYDRLEEPSRANPARRKADNARESYEALKAVFDRLA